MLRKLLITILIVVRETRVLTAPSLCLISLVWSWSAVSSTFLRSVSLFSVAKHPGVAPLQIEYFPTYSIAQPILEDL